MPTAVSLSARSLRVTGTMTPPLPARPSAANSSRAGDRTPNLTLHLPRATPAPIRASLAAMLPNPSSRGTPLDRRQRAVETAPLAGVARRPLLLDEHQQRVAVAVQSHVADPLPVARRLALDPVLVPAARPVRRPARGQRAVQRLVVHPREHEHLAGVEIGRASCRERGEGA